MAEESKPDLASTEDAEQSVQCLHQVEFYFADSNLPYDRFMWELHTKEGADHWIPIATIADFKRMRGYRDKHGLPWVVEVLRKSPTLLEVDEKGENVRRKTEVKEPKDQWDRTAYAKGFGPESEASQMELEKFFSQYAAVNAVRMRRHDATKEFKGSVFVEFAEFTDLEKFLALDPTPKWKDTELVTMTKEAYCLGKIKEKGLPDSALTAMRKTNSQSRKGFNAFRDSKGREKKGPAPPKPEVYIQYMGNTIRVWRVGEGAPKGTKTDEKDWEFVKKEDVPYVKGATLVLTGFGDNIQFPHVKEPLKELGFEPLPFIQYQKGDPRAFLIFNTPLADDKLAAIKEKITTLNDQPIEWSRLSDEEEHQVQQTRANSMGQRALGPEGKPSNGRGGGRDGGRGGGRGGSRGGGRGGGRDGGHRPHRGGARGGNDRNAEKKAAASAAADKPKEEDGEGKPANGKRKRTEVEPDGGVTQGQRGQGVPSIGTAAKKPKTEDS